MTSEELNRKFEFIVEHQARAAVLIEDIARAQRRDRLWAKRLLARMDADILEHSARMKWWEEFMREELGRRNFEDAMQKRDAEMQKRDQEAQKRHEESLARLDRIIDRLSDRQN